MCGDRWLTTGSPWEGDEMTFKTINEVLAEYSEEYIVECVNKARATPALPQGDGRWKVVNRGGDGVSDIDLDGFTIALSVGDKFAHIIVNKMNFGAALPQGVEEEACQALQSELSVMQAAIESYESPAAALKALIDWHVAVATDPRVNGGMALVPVKPTGRMWSAGRNAFCAAADKVRYAMSSHIETIYEDAAPIDVWQAMLAAAKEKGE